MANREIYRKWRRWHLYVIFSCFRIRLRFPTNACPSLPPIPLPHPAPQKNKHNKHDTWFKTTTNWYDTPRGNTTKLDLKLVSNFMGTMWDCCDTLFYDKHYRNLTGPSSTVAKWRTLKSVGTAYSLWVWGLPHPLLKFLAFRYWRAEDFANSQPQKDSLLVHCGLFSFMY